MAKTICLNMIVKNEIEIIHRCFDSVVKYIDYWVIVDTGSTDGTQQYIKDYFKKHNIPGELHEEPWKNFGYNRNHALKLAKNKADYIMLTDCDMQLDVYDKNFKNNLTADVYNVGQGTTSFVYDNTRLVKGDLDCRYVGVTHEYIDIQKPNHTKEKLKSIFFSDYADGSNRKEKFIRDINLLTEGLKEIDEEDKKTREDTSLSEDEKKKLLGHNYGLRCRYYFYLAQSYKDSQQFEKAIEYFIKRGDSGGWIEEVYYSFYQVGNCYQHLKKWDKALEFYLEAFHRHPKRLESIYKIVEYYRVIGKQGIAWLFACYAANIPFPYNDGLFIDKQIYDYLFLYEIGILAYYLNQHEKGRNAVETLIHNKFAQWHHKNTSMLNLLLYYHSLSDLTKSTVIKKLDINRTKDNYNICNPSILFRNNGDLLLNVREVNYKFIIDKNYYEYDTNIRTHNHLAVIKNFNNINYFQPDKKLKTTEIKLLNDNIIETDNNHHIVGFEDMRLIEFNDVVYGLCTTRFTTKKDSNEMVLCRLNNEFKIDKVIRLHGYEDDKCQKNWAPFIHNNKLLILYSNDPTVVLEPNLETGLCTVVSKLDNYSKYSFQDYRGGSQLVRIKNKDFDGYLYLIHQVAFKQLSDKVTRRYYYHRFVFMNTSFKITKMSPLFYFVDKSIEFVAGMTLDKKNNNLLITLGYEDKDAYLVSVSLNEALSLLTLQNVMDANLVRIIN